MKTRIIVKTQFTAIHHWPECPHDEVYYLQDPHRHIFHVTMKWKVDHDDRDKEFIMMKNKVDEFLRSHWHNKFVGKLSCEMMARRLVELFDADYVSVFEDNENGAEVERD